MSKARFDATAYQQLAMRSLNPGLQTEEEKIGHAYDGLVSEIGEIADILKRQRWHGDSGRELSGHDISRLIDEGGDILWYLAALADACGSTLAEMMARNLSKLHDRHGGEWRDDEEQQRVAYDEWANGERARQPAERRVFYIDGERRDLTFGELATIIAPESLDEMWGGAKEPGEFRGTKFVSLADRLADKESALSTSIADLKRAWSDLVGGSKPSAEPDLRTDIDDLTTAFAAATTKTDAAIGQLSGRIERVGKHSATVERELGVLAEQSRAALEATDEATRRTHSRIDDILPAVDKRIAEQQRTTEVNLTRAFERADAAANRAVDAAEWVELLRGRLDDIKSGVDRKLENHSQDISALAEKLRGRVSDAETIANESVEIAQEAKGCRFDTAGVERLGAHERLDLHRERLDKLEAKERIETAALEASVGMQVTERLGSKIDELSSRMLAFESSRTTNDPTRRGYLPTEIDAAVSALDDKPLQEVLRMIVEWIEGNDVGAARRLLAIESTERDTRRHLNNLTTRVDDLNHRLVVVEGKWPIGKREE